MGNNHKIEQFISYLRQFDISNKMIMILQKQNVNKNDLQIMDRDDVEHLFKNESGFTFRERKQFWNVLQNIQLNETSNENDDLDVTIDDIEVNHFERNSSIQSSSSNSSNVNRLSMVRTDDNESVSSSYISQLSFSSDFVFTYPTILPNFSRNITEALETNTIHQHWTAFINELARWVMSIKPCLREQHEYRAIGQSLYEKYPCIATTGPKPWSFLCRSLSQRIRTERWQRRKTLTIRKRNIDSVQTIS